jgi:hypothetical protein
MIILIYKKNSLLVFSQVFFLRCFSEIPVVCRQRYLGHSCIVSKRGKKKLLHVGKFFGFSTDVRGWKRRLHNKGSGAISILSTFFVPFLIQTKKKRVFHIYKEIMPTRQPICMKPRKIVRHGVYCLKAQHRQPFDFISVISDKRDEAEEGGSSWLASVSAVWRVAQ